MDTQKFQQALDFAKANPDDPKSTEFRKRIESGVYNDQLTALKKPVFKDGTTTEATWGDKMSSRFSNLSGNMAKFDADTRAGAPMSKTSSELLRAGGAIGGAVADTGKSVVKSIPGLETILSAPSQGTQGLLSFLEENAVHPLAQKIQELIGVDNIQALKDKANEKKLPQMDAVVKAVDTPDVKENLGAVKDIGEGVLTAIGGKAVLQKTGLEAAAGNATRNTLSAAGKVVDKTKKIVSGVGKDRTSAELAKLTEADMPKMSASERQEFVRLKKEGITEAERVAKQKVDQQLAKDVEASKKEITNLQKEVGNASADKTEALKPKVVEGIRKQSQTYEKIVEEELAPVRDTMVSPGELKSFINKRINPNDPTSVARAEKIIETLKIGGNDAQATTVGGIYDNAKALKQEISKTSKSGGKVYSAEEMEVMDSVSTLSDFLTEKGVNLTRANEFWKSWAPIRDQIVTKMRPFDVTGTRGGGFAKLLQRVSEGKADKFNANFIKQVEELVGEKTITAETKAAIAKLTDAQKIQLTKKLAAEEAKFEAKIAKEQATSKLSKEAYDAKTVQERKQWYKDTFGKLLVLVGVGATGKGVYDLIK